jgi:hypothetical protein
MGAIKITIILIYFLESVHPSKSELFYYIFGMHGSHWNYYYFNIIFGSMHPFEVVFFNIFMYHREGDYFNVLFTIREVLTHHSGWDTIKLYIFTLRLTFQPSDPDGIGRSIILIFFHEP